VQGAARIRTNEVSVTDTSHGDVDLLRQDACASMLYDSSCLSWHLARTSCNSLSLLSSKVSLLVDARHITSAHSPGTARVQVGVASPAL
jgi:hypothetical protein